MGLARFRLITFDVYSLLKFRSSPGKQYGEIGAMLGVQSDKDVLPKIFKKNWQEINEEYPNFGKNSDINWNIWWNQLITKTFEESGVQLPDDRMAKFSNELNEIYTTSTCWQYNFGLLEFLNYLKNEQISKNKFQLGVIANFDPRLSFLLKNMKLDRYFDFTINSYDCGYEKPDKEIFNMAMKMSNIENLLKSECLHIGTRPKIDYLGAINAGWNSALIHEKNYEWLKRKYGNKIIEYLCFSSLFDLHKRILANNIPW